MKKVVYIFVALMLLAGCTIDAPTIYDPEVRLLLHPEMYHHIDDEEAAVYPLDQDFSVCAWTGDREWLPLSRAFSQEVSLTDSIRKIQVTDTLWAFEEMVMWPTKKEVLSVTAYSPYDEECEVDREKGVQWSAHDVLGRPHKITVRNIIVEGVKHKGSFCSLPSPTWTLDDHMQTLMIYDGYFPTSGTPEPIGNMWLMVPQTFNTKVYVQFEYTTVEPTTITQRLSTVPLTATIEPGHDYTYTLSVGIDDVLFLKERLDERLDK